MTDAWLPAGLAFLMLVVGLRLTLPEIVAVALRPRALVAGLAVQMLLLPLLALGIARSLGLAPAMATGLLVIAAAPGGITSNYVALATRADVALSSAMTLITSFTAGISIPLLLGLAGENVVGGGAALVWTALAMTAVTALPLAAGLALGAWRRTAADRLARSLAPVSGAVFAVIVLATFWENRHAMLAHALDIGPAAVLLNLGAVAAGLATGPVLGLARRQALAIAVEAGLQNVAMAILVATVVLGRGELTAPALVYAGVMNLTALALIGRGRRQSDRGEV